MHKKILLTGSWCGPCQFLKKDLEAQGITVQTEDIDQPEGQALVQKYKIKSIPTLLEYREDAEDQRDFYVTSGAQDIIERLKKNV